jgi:hypothetical protein
MYVHNTVQVHCKLKIKQKIPVPATPHGVGWGEGEGREGIVCNADLAYFPPETGKSQLFPPGPETRK